jgi:hypothetical protein
MDEHRKVELSASVVDDYKAEIDAAMQALRAAEAKFRSYLDLNNIPYTITW